MTVVAKIAQAGVPPDLKSAHLEESAIKRIHYAWFIFLASCMLAGITIGLIYNSGGLFQPFIAEELGIPRVRVAMMQTIQSLASVVSLMFANKLLDRVNLRVIMSVCVVLLGVGFMLNSVFQSIYPYYVVFAFVGLCSPFLFGLVVPTMLTHWFRQRLGTVMGISASMTGIAGALFNPLVAFSIDRFGWRKSYFFVGVILLVTLLPLALFVIKLKPGEGEQPYGYIPEPVSTEGPAPAAQGLTARQAHRMPSFYLFMATMAFLALPGGFMQQISPHVVTLGHPVATGATVMSGVMLGIAAGKIVIGYLLDRFRAPLVMIAFGLVGISGWLGLTFFTAAPALVLCGFLAGSAHGISQVGIPVSVRRTFGVREYSKIFATITASMSLVGAVMPTVGSWIYDLTGSYITPLTITGFSYTIALPCVLLALRLGKRGAQTQAE